MQTKNIFHFFLFSAIVVLGNACTTNGPQITKEFNISDFETLHLETVGDVIYEQSPAPYLIVEGRENRVEKVRTEHEGNRLSIEIDRKWKMNNESKMVFKIGSPVLTKLKYDGVGSVTIKGAFEGNSLHIDHEGVGKLNVENCNLAEFKLDFDAVGSCTISGTSNRVEIDADGVGSVDCSRLKANIVSVNSDGVGSISVHAEKEIEIDASGVGNITYTGNPEFVKAETSGVGKIKEGN